MGFSLNREIVARKGRVQESDGRRISHPVFLRDLIQAEPFLLCARIEIGLRWIARLYSGIDHRERHRVRVAQVRYVQRATCAVMIIGTAFVIFRPLE